MKPEDFDHLVDYCFEECKKLLSAKKSEYSEGKDRLDQFKKAAIITNTSPQQSLIGMMIKHITSICDMATHEITDYRPDKWDEKIFDAINYLLLLRGIVEEAMVRKDR
jgi:hypothetical protein